MELVDGQWVVVELPLALELILILEVDSEPLIELLFGLGGGLDAVTQFIQIWEMTLLAIFSTVWLVRPLLHILLKLNLLLDSLALLKQLGDLDVLVLAQILPLDLKQEALIGVLVRFLPDRQFIHHLLVFVFALINGLSNLVIYCTEFASSFEWSAFAFTWVDGPGFAIWEQLDLLDPTACSSQIRKASERFLHLQSVVLVLKFLSLIGLVRTGSSGFLRASSFNRGDHFLWGRCRSLVSLRLIDLQKEGRGRAGRLRWMQGMVRLGGRGRVWLVFDSGWRTGSTDQLLFIVLRCLLDLQHDLKMISTRRMQR